MSSGTVPTCCKQAQRQKRKGRASVFSCEYASLECSAIVPLAMCRGVCVSLKALCMAWRRRDDEWRWPLPLSVHPGLGKGMLLYSISVEWRTYHFEQWQDWVQNGWPYMHWAIIALLIANRLAGLVIVSLCPHVAAAYQFCVSWEWVR